MLIAADQANYGNDFWQTDFNPLKKTYTITYNVKLDNSTSSTFVLKKHQLVK